jgi:hypothetical protein
MLFESLRYRCDEMAVDATCAVGRFMTFQNGAYTTCVGDRSWETVSHTVGFTYLTLQCFFELVLLVETRESTIGPMNGSY